MALGDLRYGWHQERFELRDVVIHSSVQLQQSDSKYEWIERSPAFSGVFAQTEPEQREAAEKFAKFERVRYTPRRILQAKACSQSHDGVYVGVPADRQSRAGDKTSRAEHVQLSIRAIATEDTDQLVAAGSIGYAKALDGQPAYVYAELYVPDEVFDTIELIALQPSETLEVALNIRGWYWLGPIADSELYIDTEEPASAELATVTIRRAIKARPELEAPVDGDRPADPLEDLRRTITTLRPKIEALHLAAWVTAISAVIIAISMIW